jgi:hypothetical protein
MNSDIASKCKDRTDFSTSSWSGFVLQSCLDDEKSMVTDWGWITEIAAGWDVESTVDPFGCVMPNEDM